MGQRRHAGVGLGGRGGGEPRFPMDDAFTIGTAPADHGADTGLGRSGKAGLHRFRADQQGDGAAVLQNIGGLRRGEVEADRDAGNAGLQTGDIGDHGFGAVRREDGDAPFAQVEAIEGIGGAIEQVIQLQPVERDTLVGQRHVGATVGRDSLEGE